MSTVWILLWIWSAESHATVEKRFEMPDKETCLRVIAGSKVEACKGGDCESTVTLTCVPQELKVARR